MKILVIRLMGLGDVASILVPAIKLIRRQLPAATIDAMTYGVGADLVRLLPEVGEVLAISPQEWPDDVIAAITSFAGIADKVRARNYDLVVNLDTWFMPCFLARVLKEAGSNVLGNYLNDPVSTFLERLYKGDLTQEFFENPSLYMDSSFPRMADWHRIRWWEDYDGANGYPEYYLNHCCELEGKVEFAIDVETDISFRNGAEGRKIVAISASGRAASKNYQHGERLAQLLRDNGFHVWNQFDGSLPIKSVLSRLKVTDLLITVPTSSRWLARLVGCPVLMISGCEPPVLTAAELVADRVTDCQYCMSTNCAEGRSFACMDVPPELILEKTIGFLDR
jgi:ADP-heptose:LPS heptosyltransferase